MAMRLLTKSDIDKAKAAEQKRDVDEGLKLARRIDNLREVAAQEEASLTRFRKETVAKIHEEISKEEQKRDSLRGEVAQLKRERKDLMRPLDAEWSKLHKEEARIDRRREELNAWEAVISSRERATKEAIKEASDHLAKAATKNDRATDRLKEADNDAKEAKRALANARKVEEKATALKDKVEQELTKRDMALAAKERGVAMKEANLKADREELDREWARLKDRKEAFARTIKRNK